MLKWDRTAYHNDIARVFHVCPNGATYYSDLCAKYGGDTVFIGGSATAEQTAITNALAACMSGRGDKILLYPGTYTFSAAVTVAKNNVMIEGVGDQPYEVNLDCDTSNVACFSVTGTGVTLKNFYVDESGTASNCIAATGAGFLCENVIVDGGGAAPTTASISATGDYSTIRNCQVRVAWKGISVGGNNCTVEHCLVQGTDGTSGNFGIQGTGAAGRTGQIFRYNTIHMTGATNPIGLNILANSDVTVFHNNIIGMLAANAANAMTYQADSYGHGNVALLLTLETTLAFINT